MLDKFGPWSKPPTLLLHFMFLYSPLKQLFTVNVYFSVKDVKKDMNVNRRWVQRHRFINSERLNKHKSRGWCQYICRYCSGQLFQPLDNKLCYIRVVYNGMDIVRKHSSLSPLEWIHTVVKHCTWTAASPAIKTTVKSKSVQQKRGQGLLDM